MISNSDPTNPPVSVIAIRPGHWLRERPVLMISILALLIAAALWYANSQPGNAVMTGSHPTEEGRNSALLNATPVVVATAYQDKLNIYLSGLGVVTPLNTVEVSSRVDGQLISIMFEEGQMVKANDLLAQIDPAPFEVQLKLATGQLVRDQALLDKAKVDLKRYNTLLEQDSISLQLVDTKESLVRQYQAAVHASEGAVTSAKLQLKYARITAPISGRLGFRQVDQGNIVRASNAKGIVTITQLNPISVIFPIPEDALPRVLKLLGTGERVQVDIFDRAMKEKMGEGRLLAVDNQIDAATGTIKLKAKLPNTDGALFANQFVNVKMVIEKRANATLVPTAAIQQGVAGSFVYVVKDNQSVVVTPVKIGITQGEMTVIEEGIAAGAIVVVEGADRLRGGTKVKIIRRESAISANDRRTRNSNDKGNAIGNKPRTYTPHSSGNT